MNDFCKFLFVELFVAIGCLLLPSSSISLLQHFAITFPSEPFTSSQSFDSHPSFSSVPFRNSMPLFSAGLPSSSDAPADRGRHGARARAPGGAHPPAAAEKGRQRGSQPAEAATTHAGKSTFTWRLSELDICTRTRKQRSSSNEPGLSGVFFLDSPHHWEEEAEAYLRCFCIAF